MLPSAPDNDHWGSGHVLKARNDIASASGGWRHGLLRSRADAPKLDVRYDTDLGRRDARSRRRTALSTAAAQTSANATVVLDVLQKSVFVDVHKHGGTSRTSTRHATASDPARMPSAKSSLRRLRREPRRYAKALMRRLPVIWFSCNGVRKTALAKAFGNWFKKRCREAGLEDLSAHGLRKLGAQRRSRCHRTSADGVVRVDDARSRLRFTKKANRARLEASAALLLEARNRNRSVPLFPGVASGGTIRPKDV
jgi:hypothetical protein